MTQPADEQNRQTQDTPPHGPPSAVPPRTGATVVPPATFAPPPAAPRHHQAAAYAAPPPVPAPATQPGHPATGGAVIARDPTIAFPQLAPPGAPAQATPPAAAPQAAPSATGAWSTATTRAATQVAVDTTAKATVAAPLTQALAAADAGRQDPPPAVSDPRPPSGHRDHRSVSGRLARLRIGSHTMSRSVLAQLRISSSATGLILGADQRQRPVSVRFFRPEPTRIGLVGGAWAGQLVAFRALALGARIAVVTAEPYSWEGFGERSTGHRDRVSVFTTEQPLTLAATAQQPVLVIYDLGLVGATAPQPLGPWQTQLTILRQLGQSGVPAIQECDLVLLQRLGTAEAALAGDTLRLPGPSTQYLQAMTDDMIALVGDGADQYIWFTPTELERQYGDTPRR